jgi:hypothetical protein
MELKVFSIGVNIAPSLRAPQECVRVAARIPNRVDSEQNDQGENAQKHECDSGRPQARHQLTAGVNVGGGMPFRRR